MLMVVEVYPVVETIVMSQIQAMQVGKHFKQALEAPIANKTLRCWCRLLRLAFQTH